MAQDAIDKTGEVSRQGVSPELAAKVAASYGIVLKDTDLEIKDEKGTVLKKVLFKKPIFEDGDSTPDDKFAAALAFLEELFPAVKNTAGVVTRENSPLNIMLSHLTYSFDLTQRNSIRARVKVELEGPDKAINKAAQDLAAFQHITLDDALARVRRLWKV